MDKLIIVDVTKADIAKGVRRSYSHCAVAQAILRATGASKTVVTGSCCQWTIEGRVYEAALPPSASQFVEEFDSRPVSPDPIRFELEPIFYGMVWATT